MAFVNVGYFQFQIDPCPEGWSKNGQFCYLLAKEAKNWNDASNRCKNLGGGLVSIHDAEENNFIHSKFFLYI